MAVYTQLGAEALAAIISEFDVGALVSAKGIAEGVSNSNWLIDTAGKDGNGARFILTMYEARTEVSELPFFLGLLDHLAARDCPVPRTIHDRAGQAYRLHDGKALALIEFLPGVSVSEPTADQARAVGAALAQVHLAAADFPGRRSNGLALADWVELAEACGADGLHEISLGLDRQISDELLHLAAHWPRDLPHSVIHADLFPDNVLMLGDRVTGLIDFYFACHDITAYDLAVTHAAWCFSNDGTHFDAALSQALLAGYESVRPLLDEERAALPILARGAAMRFLMTRAYDWMNTPADAMVTRKDPLAFARRLEFYADPANAGLFGRA
ncbi:homoserine kinase [Novosphingobium sp. PS1R-30]|uniref:Homoserine kinase n=1 Tax=Novosphingobium anseongense TaxID=3133436 RepID=A0ABU8RR12_9SPHN